MNICNAINYAASELKNNRINSAQLDSEILMSKVLKKDKKYLIVNSKNELNDEQYLNFRKLISNRLKGKPVAYLIGSKSFWKYDFDLNSNVLIPRPDTELIIEQVLEIYKNKKRINFLEVVHIIKLNMEFNHIKGEKNGFFRVIFIHILKNKMVLKWNSLL